MIWKHTDKWKREARGITFKSFYETYNVESRSCILPPTLVAYRTFFWKDGYIVCSDAGQYVYRRIEE